MSFTRRHVLLVRGEDAETCVRRVERFFTRNPLVRYDRVEIRGETALPATDPRFQAALAEGLRANEAAVAALIGELRNLDVKTVDELARLPQGYPSKVLHTLAHFVDGFFGIDTVLYNLVDDSHLVPAPTLRAMEAAPREFHLVTAEASFEDPAADRVPSFRHVA